MTEAMNESERSGTSIQLEDMETLISNMRLSREEDDGQGVDNTSTLRPSCCGGTTKFTERSGSTIDTCHSCESVLVMCNDDGEGGQCNDVVAGQCCDTSLQFDCEYCERLLCGECIPNVPCEGTDCKLSNCIECAENGNGDVLYCQHCGLGFCTDCKSMEYCYCLEGDACRECHAEMHDYDVELYWRHLPSDMQKLVADFGMCDIGSSDILGKFWMECVSQFLPHDDEFDLRLYRRNRRARAASLILASYYLLKGHEKEAIYLILYAALLEEVWNRGANYIKQVFDNGGRVKFGEGKSSLSCPSAKVLSVYFTSFNAVLENTATKAGMIALLHNQRSSIREKEGLKLFECIDFALQKSNTRKSHTRVHSGTIFSRDVCDAQELGGQPSFGDSLSMNIITSSKDNEMKQKNFVYKDMSLSWWLKVYVIKCMYHKWLTSPVTPSTEYYRIVHQGRTIFLSSAGTKTLHELGIRDEDEIVVEGIVAGQVPQHELEFDDMDICGVCTDAKPSVTFDTCMGCEKNACGGCSSAFFDCEYCERLLCGGCVAEVPCEGPGCDLTNCIECAENGDGDVLFCTNCGEGYCTDCKPMEFCFCLVGDTCPECHSKMHEDDVEYNWQLLPEGIQPLIYNFARGDNSNELLARFWRMCVPYLPQDKDFDIRMHRKSRQDRAASLILASYHLLRDEDSEALYLVAYAALLDEVWNRGPSYIRKVFDDYNEAEWKDGQFLAIHFSSFHSLLVNTKKKSNMAAFLHSRVQSVTGQEGKELFKCMDSGLGRMPKSNTPLHALPLLSEDYYNQELSSKYGGSLEMNVTITNMDSGAKDETVVCKDMSLGWWLRFYQIQRSYGDWLRNPEIPPSTKFFRVVHKGKTIFLSSAGKKTLHELGIKDGDEIVVGGVESEDSDPDPETKKKKVKKQPKKTNKKHKKNKKKRPSQETLSPQVLTEEQRMEQWQQEHSKTMTPVFEELGPSLKDIRNRLNDMMIKKSAPKVRRTNTKKKRKPDASPLTLPRDDCHLGGKAGKTSYPILVGEGINLYKTSKSLSRAAVTVIDLHGYTKDEAVQKLDESLPIWIATAMRECQDLLMPVDIVCGGGSQVLSEVVQNWIRSKQNVANRPKGFV